MRHINPYGKGRRETPWPLRRAEIVRKIEVDRERERRIGFVAGVEAIAKQYLDDDNWRGRVYRSAVHAVAEHAGKAIGEAIAKRLRENGFAIDYAEKVQRTLLEAAAMRIDLSAHAFGDVLKMGPADISDMTYSEFRIYMEPIDASFRIAGPRINV